MKAFVLTLSVLAAPAAALGPLVPVAAQAQTAAPSAAVEPLEIATAGGVRRFSVEVMRTPAELERGLMYRRYLPPDRGMLFDFGTSQPVMMWMKNTYIPLDMIFMSRDGTVTHVVRDAEPLSEHIIPSGGPAYAVLEVNGGTAARLGIAVGDKVRNALFGR